jgi:H+/Na+-translocating ferredoxin:NAD+ oxidoreductase subunit B
MTAALAFVVLILLLAGAVAAVATRLRVDPDALVKPIDALLPQSQCTLCGYPGCRPYARAIAHGEANINRCPPGGGQTIDALARLLGRRPLALDPSRGPARARSIARIDEATCIGCTLCIQACPVDAIVGSAKLMHTVIEAECTGCELCLPPCPVDCIEMAPLHDDAAQIKWRRPTVIALPIAARR